MQLTGRAFNQVGYRAQLWIGCFILAIAVALVIAGLLAHTAPICFSAIGPFIAGMVNIAVASAIKKKTVSGNPNAVRLTPEAKQMMSVLLWKFVWRQTPWFLNDELWGSSSCGTGGDGGYRAAWDRKYSAQFDTLPAQTLALLEAAALNYNRIQGTLELRRQTDTVLERMASKVSIAADETMADILHQAALFGRFPETSAAIVRKIEDSISKLQEIADRLEKIALTEPSFEEKLISRSGAQDVIDELRMEQLARTELISDTRDDVNVHENT